jgi:GTPase SAR1 family protein
MAENTDWSEDEDMKYDDVVEKVEHPCYALWKSADGSVTMKLKGHFSDFSHDIAQFTNTRSLKVLSTDLASLPHDIEQFKEIRHLQIGLLFQDDESLDAVEVSRCVEHMHQLEELEVWHKVAISHIPRGIFCHITTLRKLAISWCGLTSLPHDLKQLLTLQHLDLKSNKLEHLPDTFCSLINLRYLDLTHNPFVALHEELPFESLTNIVVLVLKNTELSLLPPGISHMTAIQELDIRCNRVSSLPREICQLHQLEKLSTYSNPLVSPPAEVCEQQMPAVRAYFQSLSRSVPVKRKRMKVLICGKYQAGKTSLSRTLAIRSPCCTEISDRTIGIEESQFTLGNGTNLIVIDCGGHRSYLLSNQLLVSDKSVNLVVVDVSEYKSSEKYFREHVGHYIQMILERCRLGAVLTVFTKADLLPSDTDRSEVLRHYVLCLEEMLSKREQQMKQYAMQSKGSDHSVFLAQQNVEITQDVIFVSSLKLEGFDQLYKKLEEISSTDCLRPTLEAVVPETWVTFEDRLKYSANVALGKENKPNFFYPENRLLVVNYSSTVPVWSLDSVISYSVRCGIAENEVQAVLPYLHQVSSILYFSLYPSLRLTLFGQVSFVIDVLKTIFYHDHEGRLQYDRRFRQYSIAVTRDSFKIMKSELVNNACLAMPLLLALWSSFDMEKHHLDVFFKLLIHFEFAYIVAERHVEERAMKLCNFKNEDEGEEEQSESGNDQFHDPVDSLSE